MIPAFDPLARVKADLERIIRARSANDLADRLVGRGLPALGGDEEPAEILFRALILSPTRPGTPRILADLLGTLCAATCAQLEALREVRGVVGVTLRSDTGLDAVRSHLERNEPYLYNSFLLASLLPPSDDLFDSLKRLRQLGLETNVLLAGGGRTSRQLLQALIYQQTDDSLFEMWLGLLRSDASAGDANLLDAWTGLLWTPPSDALRNAGESLDVRRVAIGLDALHHGVQRLPSALRYLRTAVRQLRDSFARSPDFWARELRPLLNILPELVNEVLCEQWPNLDESDPHYMPTLSQRAEAVWSSLEDHERQSILSAADKSVDRPWDEIWTNLLFQPPRLQLPPQEVRTALFEIRHALERRYPGVAPQARPDIPDTETSPQERLERRPRRRSPRLAEFERVQGVLVEVDQQLQVGDLIRATEYLEDLLKSQEQAGTEAALVAKTLSNAGHLALRRGYAGWAMQLYQRAEDLHVGDPVIGNGLAEVLRALGRLEEAEWKYRNTVSSFPNDVVAHCGLAEVLKEQGRLDEAEQQYRLTIATFPESVVAHNGLAEILREEGQLDQAEQEYRITASSFPNDAVALSGLAEVLKEQGRLDEAEREYRIAISTFPNSVFAQNGLAEVLKEQGRLDEAEQQYRIALSTFPNNAVAQSGLAEVLKEQGRLDEAEQQYRIAISTFSHNVVAQSGLAEVLREQGRLDEAEQQFRLAASTFPNDVVA
ncbi:MAG TPA: tetratricopeptide repeat protein, partial [Thermoanaerobaculia bacterium]|nr:tetratricopeptide repeat protein [Thermoanaerobaculia bacterium]